MVQTNSSGEEMDRILRLPDVLRICGASRSSLYLWQSAGIFPQSVKLGIRAVGWRKSEIEGRLEKPHPCHTVSDKIRFI